jgi:2-phospho-L-lactate/phosphoenolpyruvate guanylyltransferase
MQTAGYALAMRTAAILPVKHFAQAKQRLGASLPDPLRLELARAMVGDVLAALGETASIERTIVVTAEPSMAELAHARGAIVIDDTAQDGQSAAVSLGVKRALTEGMERALCVPGDCPTLDPDELAALLSSPASNEPEVVIVPDRHGTGTNGLLLAPPGTIRPSFGLGSCERHRALANAAEVRWRIERPASLLLDIDTGEDLTVLRTRLVGDRTSGEHRVRAPRTRALLDRTAGGDRPSITIPA